MRTAPALDQATHDRVTGPWPEPGIGGLTVEQLNRTGS